MARRVIVVAVAWLTAGSATAQEAPNPSFYLLNRATVAIRRVFATPAGQQGWGQNRLGSATIEPGGNFPIRLPADGKCVYDIRVIWNNGHTEERRDLNVCDVDKLGFPEAPGAPAAERQAAEASFRLVNRSRSAVNELYLSVSGDDSWGDDRLGDDSLPAGATKVIRLPPGECVYDLRVVFANGEANEKRRVNLCQISSLRVP